MVEADDIVQAFLLPTLRNGEVYHAYPPAGFHLLCAARGTPFKKGQVLLLLAAIYGLKNASYYWNTEFTQWLIKEAGLTQCVNDPCLFICYKRKLAVGVHTDDCLIVGNSVRAAFRKQFSNRISTENVIVCEMKKKTKNKKQKKQQRNKHTIANPFNPRSPRCRQVQLPPKTTKKNQGLYFQLYGQVYSIALLLSSFIKHPTSCHLLDTSQ